MLNLFSRPEYNYWCDMLVFDSESREYKRCRNFAEWDNQYSKYLLCDQCCELVAAESDLVKPPEGPSGKEVQDQYLQKLLNQDIKPPGYTDD